MQNIPTFSTGFALNPTDSRYPYLWNGLVGMWCPSIGKQGDNLLDLSLYNRHGTLNNMDSGDYVGGINGYTLNYDGTNNFINIGNILEINDASQDISIIQIIKTTGTGNDVHWYYDNNDALSPSTDAYLINSGNLQIGGIGQAGQINTGIAVNDGLEHQVAVVLKDTSLILYVDTIPVFITTVAHNHADYATSLNFRIADNANVAFFNGEIGNTYVYRRAVEPSELKDLHNNRLPISPALLPFVGLELFGFNPASPLDLNLSLESPSIIIDADIDVDPLDINLDIPSPLVGEILVITPNSLDIISSIESPTISSELSITPDILSITSSLEVPFFPVIGSQIAKIISVNPLIAVTDTSPVQIIKIDTTDPENLVYTSVTIANINNAKDFSVNSTNDFVYVAGDNGKVVKVEIADLTNQITIDVNDTDSILTIETNSNFGLTYAGTENNVGELYVIDERNTFLLDSDFRVISPQEFKVDFDFNIVATFKVASNFQLLAQQTFLVNTDFKCLTKIEAIVFPPSPPDPSPPPTPSPIVMEDTIIPINLENYQVFIDSVELGDIDLVLNSISITHSVGQESRATFRLTRKHDQLNTTLEGNTVTITNQNQVEIKCNGVTIFPFKNSGIGRISELDCQYNNNEEFIQVNALAPEAINQFNNITMSLPSLNSRLSLYDILIQNPNIFDPFIDPNNEDNPKKFKGIRVDLGTEIQQSLSKFTINDGSKSIADDIQEGTFNPIQNWTYFWSPTVTKVGNVELGQSSSIRFFYIGTSLAPVSEDLWDLNQASHFRQRIFDDIETDLGFFEVGEAPFRDIIVRNGIKNTKPKLVDEPDRLSSIKDAGFDFVNFAKRVAELELEKLKNINGDILPDTSCTFNLTIDAFLYYDISLLTRINIDNTTESGIYKNFNGFPLSIKSITINSSNRRVILNTDNTKSTKELEEIDGQFPDEDDQEYNTPETRTLISLKSDMRTRTQVQ